MLIFFDDILVFSLTMNIHILHLEEVLRVLRDNSLFAKKSKCSFGKSELQFLGHIISGKGVQSDPKKVEAIQAWPIPTSIKGLRGFLGISVYYRKFVKNYAHLAAPLSDMLRKNNFL